jgi:rare lipoprotein A
MKEVPVTYVQMRVVPLAALVAFLLVQSIPVSCLQAREVRPDVLEEKGVRPPETQVITEGIASYYADRFNGRKTRSGAVYDPEKLTAAHPDLPFGTRVKVVNIANNRSVTITVNDRCRRKSFPFIDLSRSAARQLGFLGKGRARVSYSVVERDSEP